MKPPTPDALHGVEKASESPPVPGDAEVRVVPLQLPGQSVVLVGDRRMPVLLAPLRYPAQRAAEAAGRRLLHHHPVALPGATPVVREAQQVEAPRPASTCRWCDAALRRAPAGRG